MLKQKGSSSRISNIICPFYMVATRLPLNSDTTTCPGLEHEWSECEGREREGYSKAEMERGRRGNSQQEGPHDPSVEEYTHTHTNQMIPEEP